MGTVGEWPRGFVFGGSSIQAMNGPFVRIERDNTLPYDSHVTVFRNSYTGWTIIAGQNAKGFEYDTPYDNSNGEWLVLDADGHPRLGCAGGSYLPASGEYWHFVKRHPKWSKFKVGEVAIARETIPNFWKKGDRGKIVEVVKAGVELPLSWQRISDGKKFEMQGWRLWKEIGAAEESPAGSSTAVTTEAVEVAGDESALPWQIVGINAAEEIWKMKQGFEAHLQEVDAAIGSTRVRDLQNARSSESAQKLSADEKEEQLRLFERALGMLDGGRGRSKDGKKKMRGGDQIDPKDAFIVALSAQHGGCKAAAAVVLLEALLRTNRAFRYQHPSHEEDDKGQRQGQKRKHAEDPLLGPRSANGSKCNPRLVCVLPVPALMTHMLIVLCNFWLVALHFHQCIQPSLSMHTLSLSISTPLHFQCTPLHFLYPHPFTFCTLGPTTTI
jgi:hypothetical protein